MKFKIKWYEVVAIQWMVMMFVLAEATPTQIYKFQNDLLYLLWALWVFFLFFTVPISIILNALKHDENINN